MPSHLQRGRDPDLWKSKSRGRSCSTTPRIVPGSGLFLKSRFQGLATTLGRDFSGRDFSLALKDSYMLDTRIVGPRIPSPKDPRPVLTENNLGCVDILAKA
jgi:hypothetical protein